ncbi:MAG: hypothetical protein JWM32_1975 [Verrucomicrobia bacterium]|nr:hypothetical protein [Verrucomicrobiota bacterium]
MNTKKKTRRAQPGSSKGKLFELELRIARRADELVKTARSIPGRSLECWLRAEREVFADVIRFTLKDRAVIAAEQTSAT